METGKLIIIIGTAIILIGLVISYAPWLINWFGKLPGDIKIENERSSIFIPITSMIVISIILSLILNLFLRK